MGRKRVVYYYDPDVGAYTYGLGHPMKPQRMRMTHELVSAYDMLDKMHVLRPKRATGESMTKFHTDEYIHFLERVTPETAEQLTYHGNRFLTGEDNPAFDGLFEFCSISAGGSIAAAQRIASGSYEIAINWAGGLHHAKKREASGFCYVNDIVLSILELLRSYPRVLYIDIDCHHGDGVEEAFYTTDRVMTVSFHKYGEYFPGTGTQQDKGRGKGYGYALNVPLRDGITDETYKGIFEPVMGKCLEIYRPSVVVLQCGADSLSGDKLGCFNLTMQGHANCVKFIKDLGYPMILLGGGGYTVKNVARLWTYETAVALGIENDIDGNLPWNEYFEWFGPRYRLEVAGNNMDDLNARDGYLDAVRTLALEQLSRLPHAPSVGLHDVPSESVGTHIGLKDYDELDERLAQHSRYVYRLQEAAGNTTSESSDEEDDDSSASGPYQGRKSRKRMSIITNQYQDTQMRQRRKEFEKEFAEVLSNSHTSEPRKEAPQRRRFFQSGAKWDGLVERVMVMHREIGGPGPLQVPPLPPINSGPRKSRNGDSGFGNGGGNGENEYGSGQWGEDSDDDDGDYRDEDEDDLMDEDRGDPTPDRDMNGQWAATSSRRKKTLYY